MVLRRGSIGFQSNPCKWRRAELVRGELPPRSDVLSSLSRNVKTSVAPLQRRATTTGTTQGDAGEAATSAERLRGEISPCAGTTPRSSTGCTSVALGTR